MRYMFKKELLELLNSDMDEATFFGYNKSSLITLKEYLEELRNARQDYQVNIAEPLKSIKRRNKWVETVTIHKIPYTRIPRPVIDEFNLIFNGKNAPHIAVETNTYTSAWPVVPFATGPTKRIREEYRKKILENSRDEIVEIGIISAKHIEQLRDATSVSGQFIIKNNYNYSSISSQVQGFFKIDRETIVPYDDITYMIKEDSYSEIKLNADDRKKLLKKIMIRK